ncbi:MAG: hypothetical protein MUC55_10010 [Burkholderiales bacterium]|nr:hypothetical protein [Burkholderiales bacterium]
MITTPSTGERIAVRSRLALLHQRLGIACLRLRDGKLGLGRLHALLRLVEHGERAVALGGRDELLGVELFFALVVALDVAEVHLLARHHRALRADARLLGEQRRSRRLDVSFGLAHFELERFRVDLRDQLALLDRRVEIDEQILDLPRHLRADLDRRHRRERSGCGDDRSERAALDLDETIGPGRLVRRDPLPEGETCESDEHCAEGDPGGAGKGSELQGGKALRRARESRGPRSLARGC